MKKTICFDIFGVNLSSYALKSCIQFAEFGVFGFIEKRGYRIMRNQGQKEQVVAGVITFPPTETVCLDDATVQRLLAEGMEIRRAIEKSAARMFAVSSSDFSPRMR